MRQTDGSDTLTWTTVTTSFPLRIHEIREEKRQRDWGLEVIATDVGQVLPASDIKTGDGLIVTDGDRTGERFKVNSLRRVDGSRGVKHLELALESTTETFT